MASRLSRLIQFLFLVLFFLTPLIYRSTNSELFEIPKMYFIYLVSLIIIFLHLFNHLHYNAPLFRPHPINRLLLLFFTSQVVATIFSIDRHTSFFGFYSRMNGGLLSLITFSSLFFIFPNYLDKKYSENIITTILISGAIVTAHGILQHFGVDKSTWKQDVQSRVFSTLGQPNWLAAYLCILLPFSLDRFFSSSRPIFKSCFLLLTSSFWLCLLFTKSKSGIIAAILSLGIYFFISLFQKNISKKLLIINYSLLIILSLLVTNPIKDIIFPNKISNSSLVISNLNITPSEDIRKIVWQGAINLWKQHPILGTGPETFAFSYYWTRPASHNLTSEWQFLYNKAHNEYINYLATSGIVGFISYLIFVFYVLYIIRNTIYLIPFISILITNISGFSVATTSLFFFILPLLAVDFPAVTPKSYFLNLKSKLLFTVLLIISFSFLIINCFKYYLADLTYKRAVYFDEHNNYQEAYKNITTSLELRKSEPTYLVEHSTIASKLAITTKDVQYADTAIKSLNKAVSISPYDTNLLKQRAQNYYYLSALDKNYYLDTLNTLIHLTELAPTDPTNFYLLGRFYQNISETDRAITNYQQAINLKANYDHALFALGKIYFDQKKYSDAKPLFEQTLTIAPTNLDAKNYLARIATASASK